MIIVIPVICLSGMGGTEIQGNFSTNRSYNQSKCLNLWETGMFVCCKDNKIRFYWINLSTKGQNLKKLAGLSRRKGRKVICHGKIPSTNEIPAVDYGEHCNCNACLNWESQQ